jgi:hypothetical protein
MIFKKKVWVFLALFALASIVLAVGNRIASLVHLPLPIVKITLLWMVVIAFLLWFNALITGVTRKPRLKVDEQLIAAIAGARSANDLVNILEGNYLNEFLQEENALFLSKAKSLNLTRNEWGTILDRVENKNTPIETLAREMESNQSRVA